ncbi:MAG: VanZ family protein [Prolixibacteraceae bacterium]
MILKRRYFFPFIWIGLLSYASLSPSKNVPDFSFIPHFDKFVHFCMYFGLAFLLIPALLKNKKYINAYWFAFIISILSGSLFELIQTYFTTSRTGSIYDEIANATGALFGIFAYQILFKNKRMESIIFKIE